MKNSKLRLHIFGYKLTPLFWKIFISMAFVVCIFIFAMMDFPASSLSVASASDSVDSSDASWDGENWNDSSGSGASPSMLSGKPADSQTMPDSNSSDGSPADVSGETPKTFGVSSPSDSSLPADQTPASDGLFSRTAFIGDSRTEGLLLYSGAKGAADYAIKGLNVKSVFSNTFITNASGKTTVIGDMKNKSFDKVYVSFGLNELGWNIDTYVKKYTELVTTVRELQPDASIYIQSTFPINPDKCKFDDSANKRIQLMNDQLRQMAASMSNVYYVDLYAKFQDSRGYLNPEASSDGIHLNKKYCIYWLKCLEDNLTGSGTATPSQPAPADGKNSQTPAAITAAPGSTGTQTDSGIQETVGNELEIQ